VFLPIWKIRFYAYIITQGQVNASIEWIQEFDYGVIAMSFLEPFLGQVVLDGQFWQKKGAVTFSHFSH
jgi:hypothetical protein